MTGFLIKLIACPGLLFVSSLFFRQIYFPATYQIALIGLALALILHLIELWTLNANNLWMITSIDFVVTTLFIYFSQYLFNQAVVSIDGAILAGILINISEHYQHNWLLLNRKVS